MFLSQKVCVYPPQIVSAHNSTSLRIIHKFAVNYGAIQKVYMQKIQISDPIFICVRKRTIEKRV